MLVIAPLSAHTLAKIANGMCDDLLTSVVRAWDWGHGPEYKGPISTAPHPPPRRGKPIVLAPAMNTAMWNHPVTAQQLKTVQSFWNKEREGYMGVTVVNPQVKVLACGELGEGALADPVDIVNIASEALCGSVDTKDSNKDMLDL
jgi:phosphopantothenoylcysteine decarboxylase